MEKKKWLLAKVGLFYDVDVKRHGGSVTGATSRCIAVLFMDL